MLSIIRISTLILLAAPLAVQAFNLRFLEDAPASQFNDRDWELLTEIVDAALVEGARGDVLEWENARNGHRGTVTIMGSLRSDEQPCRMLKVYNEASTARGESIIKFCQQSDGEWLIVTQSPVTKK